MTDMQWPEATFLCVLVAGVSTVAVVFVRALLRVELRAEPAEMPEIAGPPVWKCERPSPPPAPPAPRKE